MIDQLSRYNLHTQTLARQLARDIVRHFHDDPSKIDLFDSIQNARKANPLFDHR